MLEIRELHASVEDTPILKGLNLTVNPGEVHAIMGPNGSGKSTLAKVIAGREDYTITGGEMIFDGKDLTELAPEERAWAGIFLAFQYPVEIPGVDNVYFLKAAVNAMREHRGLDPLDAFDFLQFIRAKARDLEFGDELLKRPVNVGFSGGEKKRNEIMQMTALEPKLAILDETDSGLDIDAMKVVAHGVNKFRSPENGVIVITHYQRLLSYIVPDYVHVLMDGQIVKSGDRSLALELDERGYDWVRPGAAS